jgi:hypothetical protein
MEPPMLTDLYLLDQYFEEPAAAMYREDVIRKFGAAAFEAALCGGLIEACCLPCRDSESKVLCRLSEKGRKAAAELLDS